MTKQQLTGRAMSRNLLVIHVCYLARNLIHVCYLMSVHTAYQCNLFFCVN